MITKKFNYILSLFFLIWSGGFLFGGITILPDSVGIFLIVIGCLGLSAAVFFFISSLKASLITKKVKRNGKKVTATFVSYTGAGSINNVAYFYITFAWRNNKGEEIKTKSLEMFTSDELSIFKQLNTFDVWAYENNAIITEIPKIVDNPSLTQVNENIESQKEAEDPLRCPKCGARKKGDEKRCIYCGVRFK